MHALLVISSVQSNLLLKNVFFVFPPASIDFAILRVGIVRYVFLLLKEINILVKKYVVLFICAVDVAYFLVVVEFVCSPCSFYRASSARMGELRRG